MSDAGFSLGLGSHKISTDVCLGVEASSQGAHYKQLSHSTLLVQAAMLKWQEVILIIWRVIFSWIKIGEWTCLCYVVEVDKTIYAFFFSLPNGHFGKYHKNGAVKLTADLPRTNLQLVSIDISSVCAGSGSGPRRDGHLGAEAQKRIHSCHWKLLSCPEGWQVPIRGGFIPENIKQ